MKRQHPTDPNLFWCPKCETYKTRENFGQQKGGVADYCRLCDIQKRRDFRDRHPGKKAEYSKRYRDKNRERLNEYGREHARKLRKSLEGKKKLKEREERYLISHGIDKLAKWRESRKRWAEEHREEHLKLKREEMKKNVIGLSDRYIRNYVLGQKNAHKWISADEVTPEIIEIKRQQIIFHRELKQLKKEVSNGTA